MTDTTLSQDSADVCSIATPASAENLEMGAQFRSTCMTHGRAVASDLCQRVKHGIENLVEKARVVGV